MRVLIVEDETKLAEALVQIFGKNKITADACFDGISGLDNALSGIYDVIVLDIMLPGMNGIEVLKNLRKENVKTPVLLLTAMDEVSDKVKGFDSGADDYLTKPFYSEELLARVKALNKRNGNNETTQNENKISYGDITLDLSAYEMSCKGNRMKLGLKEFSILEYFMKNAGQVLSKENILLKVWGYESDAEYNNVEVYISFLRKKMSFIKSDTSIKTVRGVGYCLEKIDR